VTEPTANPPVWILSDGAAGNERQAMALAQAMRLRADSLRVGLRGPWRWFAPRLRAGTAWALPATLHVRLRAPWPALAIGCGRHAALVTSWLRRASAGKTFTVQILDPRIDAGCFDLVIAPRHDELAGANVIQTIGSLNPVDEIWLADGMARFSTMSQLPQPRTAVLLGGPRRGLDMDAAWFGAFLARVNALAARDGGSLLVSASRRTPDPWRRAARERLRAACVHFWTGPDDGENPYQGYLAAAERIVVTPDSVNMLSEACAAGKPVLTLLAPTARGKIPRLHAELRAQGWLHDFAENVDLSTLLPLPPLRELAAVSSKVWHVIEATRPELSTALAAPD
jgi:mitochondrial fission protein ELM1